MTWFTEALWRGHSGNLKVLVTNLSTNWLIELGARDAFASKNLNKFFKLVCFLYFERASIMNIRAWESGLGISNGLWFSGVVEEICAVVKVQSDKILARTSSWNQSSSWAVQMPRLHFHQLKSAAPESDQPTMEGWEECSRFTLTQRRKQRFDKV